MASRRPEERKVVVSLPLEVAEWLEREAGRKFTSTGHHLRAWVIDAYLEAQDPQAAETTSARGAVRGARATRSGFKGVHAYGKRWATVAHQGGRSQRLGVYDTAEEAARAYDQYLIARAGDPNAAVNFPTPLDQLRDTSAPFVERFAATGQMNDIEWRQWQDATKGQVVPDPSPMPTVPPSAATIDAKTPLVDRPARSLFKRDVPTPTPPTPMIRPDPVPAEPDEGPESVH